MVSRTFPPFLFPFFSFVCPPLSFPLRPPLHLGVSLAPIHPWSSSWNLKHNPFLPPSLSRPGHLAKKTEHSVCFGSKGRAAPQQGALWKSDVLPRERTSNRQLHRTTTKVDPRPFPFPFALLPSVFLFFSSQPSYPFTLLYLLSQVSPSQFNAIKSSVKISFLIRPSRHLLFPLWFNANSLRCFLFPLSLPLSFSFFSFFFFILRRERTRLRVLYTANCRIKNTSSFDVCNYFLIRQLLFSMSSISSSTIVLFNVSLGTLRLLLHFFVR